MKRCTVTAIAPDGRRTSCEVQATSRNYAVFAYNARAISDPKLIPPLPDTGIVFEVTFEGRETMRVSRAATAWPKREAARSAAEWAKNKNASRRARFPRQ